jgi:hypothetical protein
MDGLVSLSVKIVELYIVLKKAANVSGKKIARFVGGPLDGKTREVNKDQTIFEVDEPPPEDIHAREISAGFFPPFHKYVYEESPAGSGTFIYKK